MCFKQKEVAAEENTPTHSVAQMGDNYQLTTEQIDPEVSQDDSNKKSDRSYGSDASNRVRM
jgi:hypothetical protein